MEKGGSRPSAGQHFGNHSAFEEGEIKARQLPRPSSSISFIASLRFIRSPRPWDFAARGGGGGWARRSSDRAASAREEGRRGEVQPAGGGAAASQV